MFGNGWTAANKGTRKSTGAGELGNFTEGGDAMMTWKIEVGKHDEEGCWDRVLVTARSFESACTKARRLALKEKVQILCVERQDVLDTV